MRLNDPQSPGNENDEAREQDPLMTSGQQSAGGGGGGETGGDAERTEKDDHRSLIMRVKNDQYFQPDLNAFTMWFKRKEEAKYQEYLLGMNHSLVSPDPSGRSSSSAESATNTGQHHHSNVLISAQYGTIISALLSFIINVCVSTAFLLTFIVSTLTEYEFKTTVKYKVFFGTYLGLYVLFILIQLAVLLVVYLKFTNKPTQSTQPQAPMSLAARSANNTRILVKYLLLHLLSSLMLILVPVYILVNGLPVMSDLVLNHSSHQKLINFFSIYFYFCYVVSLIHFAAFVQLNSLFKMSLALVFALVCGVASFVGLCAITSDNRLNTITASSLFLSGFLKGKFND
jgi:large-conductance mechanosensitive channel